MSARSHAKPRQAFPAAAICPLLAILATCHHGGTVTPAHDYTGAWHASRECFLRANVLLHAHLLACSASDLDALVDAENRLGDADRQALRAAAEEGVHQARVAIATKPGSVEGHLYLALNLGFLGLTQSRTRSLLDGLAPEIRGACDKAIDIDGRVDAGGAYRFLGKFLMTAPWPVRDMEQAETALRKANEIAEVPQNYLFLGDLCYKNGRLEQAREAWRRALATPPHPSTEVIDAAVHELARRRLAASGR